MAKGGAGGTAKNLRDSKPKYLGVKLYDGQTAKAGSIIVRQRGTKMLAGKNVGLGNDHSLYALISGVIRFSKKRKQSFHGKTKQKVVVNVDPPA